MKPVYTVYCILYTVHTFYNIKRLLNVEYMTRYRERQKKTKRDVKGTNDVFSVLKQHTTIFYRKSLWQCYVRNTRGLVFCIFSILVDSFVGNCVISRIGMYRQPIFFIVRLILYSLNMGTEYRVFVMSKN